ncbi:carbohydrate ABC transporter substrate-binding protein [Natronospirillum operosum]|uniref:Carbohydrate ABC transporter substrate-binding protein n=1 Tax=Natronospirillum operosum TaxID=2759953 RepID=A0A4Z0WB83_9GAMM|nr:ABC transporter substrate-binding protein [Natronospirillum operosum]TGG91346.1 carbohydrate ABC transporter substrate-binding protein [Natronospirillum operosum]
MIKKRTLAVAIASAALASGAMAQNLHFPVGEGPFSWEWMDEFSTMDLSGQTVTVAGPWLGDEQTSFRRVLAYFEEATGANVDYAGSDSFEQQIQVDTQAGSPPNMAIFPQPGLAEDLAAQNLLVPLGSNAANWVRANFSDGDGWADLGTFENRAGEEHFYGVMYRVDLKSLVWYVPDNFEDYGYEVPTSMEEMIALSDQMVADGETPWTIGLGSGAATGWPATDWVEDLMLRMHPPEVYDGWVTNDIPFNDPRVVEVIEEFGKFARNPDYVAGGVQAVATTDFRDAPQALFDIPPRAFMHRQANFIPAFFPDDVVIGEDVDFFYMPSYEERDLGDPVLSAGTMMAITRDSNATRALLQFLQTPLAHELWMAQGQFLTVHLGANVDAYASDVLRRQGEILLEADTVRFDASDMMPGAIGAGTFWTGMVDFVGGTSAQDVADAIQRSWDEL